MTPKEKLISHSDFTEEIENYVRESHNYERGCELIFKHREFIKQPLELWMFIPCDEKGNVLEEPESLKGFYETHSEGMIQESKLRKQYYEAKDRVLFDCGVKIDTSSYRSTKRMLIDLDCKGGFRLFNRHIFHDGDIEEKFLPNFTEIPTIEYLVKYNLTLTESAIKQLGQELEIKQQ